MCRGAAVDVGLGLGDDGAVAAPMPAGVPGWEAAPGCWPPCCWFTVCHSRTTAVTTSAAATIPTIQRRRAFLPAGGPGSLVAALMGVPRAYSAAQSWSPRQRYYARRRAGQEQEQRQRQQFERVLGSSGSWGRAARS